MLPSTKALASDLKFAVMDSLKHQGVDKHQALLAVVDLIDDKEALSKAMHSGLDQYCNYLKSIKNYDF